MQDVEAIVGGLLVRGEVCIAPSRWIAQRIAALLERRDFGQDELVRLASADPGVAARLLAAAAEISGGEAPASLPLAVARIGEPAFLAIAREVAAEGGERGPLDALRRSAWRGAVGSAWLCRALARARGLDPEAAWLCGLLHDVGLLAGLSAAERLSAGARASRGASVRWEHCLERWHVPLGLSLAARLGLPRVVSDAIAFHDGEVPATRSRELVRVVRTADAVVRVLREEEPLAQDGEAIGELSEEEAERLAPAAAALPHVVAALEAGGASRRRGRAPRGDGEAPAPLHESKGEGVRLRVAGVEHVATGVAPHQLVVAGPAPLGEGAILEVEVIERRCAVFHARVLLSWRDGGRFAAVLAPFALGWPEVVAWEGRTLHGARA